MILLQLFDDALRHWDYDTGALLGFCQYMLTVADEVGVPGCLS